MFATDRDLLAFEPGLFGAVAWAGQRLMAGTGDISSGTLTLTAQDLTFELAGVTTGHVALVDGLATEVVLRVTATSVIVSKLRASTDAASIIVPDATGKAVEVYTFAPQIADVHRRVLRMLGLEPDGEAAAGEPYETSILNTDDLARLEALGALHLIYAGASAVAAGSSVEAEKADWYRRRFMEERGRVVAQIDLNGDGKADAVRRPTAMRFVRL